MTLIKKLLTQIFFKKKNLDLFPESKNSKEAKDIKTLIKKGNDLEDKKNMLMALAFYEKATFYYPNDKLGYLNKGNIFLALRELDMAINLYQKAISLDSYHPGFYANLGNAYFLNDQWDLALNSYEKALTLDDRYVDAWVGRGNVFSMQGSLDDGIESYKQAIALDSKNPDLYRSLAINYVTSGYVVEAIENFEIALKLKPTAYLYADLNYAYRFIGEMDKAIATLEKACKLDTEFILADSLLLFTLSCQANISRKVLYQKHLDFGKKVKFYKNNEFPAFLNTKNKKKKLRIGIVSADLYNHVVVTFFEPIYDILVQNSSLELYIYNNGAKQDTVTKRLKEKCKSWANILDLTDHDAEQRIRSDEIDILIDLSGHTPGHRLTLFARKPAPIQMTWIGYPGTTGMSEVDYFVGDRHFLPPGKFDDIFSEKILRLPATTPFNPESIAPDVNELPATDRKYITFGSFNRFDKINEDVIKVWSKVLMRIPSSKMLIGALPITGDISKIVKWFQKYEVSVDRLIFHKRTDMYRYLLLHHDVDVCLDAFPYGASTTSCHALFMGVPTITLEGETPPTASGPAFLSQLDLAHLFVAKNKDDYVKKAIWCSNNIEELSKIRSGLREKFKSSTVMNPDLIGKAFTAAMQYAWQRWCDGLPPTSFEVVNTGNDFIVLNQ